MPLLARKSESRELVEGGDYLALVTNVEEVKNDFAQVGQDPTQVRITFQLEYEEGVPMYDSDGKIHTQWGYMGWVLGYKKDGTPYKSQAWSNAIMSTRVPQDFDFEDLMQHRCILVIDDTKADGITPTNKVDKIKPYTGKSPYKVKPNAPHKPAEVQLNANGTVAPGQLKGISAGQTEHLRRWTIARNTLIEADVKASDMNKACMRIAKSNDAFQALSEDVQAKVLEHFELWAGEPDLYDSEGNPKDISFE